MTEEAFHFAHMHTVKETLAYLFKDPGAFQKAASVEAQLSYTPFVAAMKMEPTLIPLLKKLRPAYKTAVATNRSDSMPTLLREHDIAPYFDLIVSASDVARPKPHPDQLLRLLDYFNVSPMRCSMWATPRSMKPLQIPPRSLWPPTTTDPCRRISHPRPQGD